MVSPHPLRPRPAWARGDVRFVSSAGCGGLVLAAPAKLNLFLEVLGKRPDGYHALETLMVAVDLFDTLELRPLACAAIELECDPPGLSTGPENLVYKAAERLRAAANRPELGAAIRLTKRIPAQAGMAGGSSDAATAIEGLNAVWNLGLGATELARVAAEVGSDVAFFLRPPAAWCTGRGEIVEPERGGRAFDFVVVNPPVGVSTAAAFKALAPVSDASQMRPGTACRQAFRSGDADALGASLFNRLQSPAFGLAPLVEVVYRRLAGLNPAGCLMSGSGSAVFALCRSRTEAVALADAFRAATPPGEPESRVSTVRSLHIDSA
jgi:4-diphosphocytidyl-2-C-methyl-D-erythritol kinase